MDRREYARAIRNALYKLRATRASSPGLIGGDAARREVFAAALAQSEDLFEAAAAIGPLGSPLPLFYAVSQAGRAIAAAHLADDWKVGGHGLAQAGDFDATPEDVLNFTVQPQRQPGVFGSAARALGEIGLTGPVEVGALWAALPRLSLPGRRPDWHQALPIWPQQYSQGLTLHLGAERRAHVYLRDEAPDNDAAAIKALLTQYPAAVGARVQVIQGIIQTERTPWGIGVPVEWPAKQPESPDAPVTEETLRAADVHRVVPQYRYGRQHWLVPRVGDNGDALSPLLLWWALLHGLSLLARYEPVIWRAALDPDASPLAVDLVELLDEALDVVPELLAGAISGQPELQPALF